MQIWKMKPDGSEQTQVTSDEFNNWFAHPSPDGRFLVFLSYDKSVSGHPANQDVRLRRMTLATGARFDRRPLLRRAGHAERPQLVARWADRRVRDLPARPAVVVASAEASAPRGRG